MHVLEGHLDVAATLPQGGIQCDTLDQCAAVCRRHSLYSSEKLRTVLPL